MSFNWINPEEFSFNCILLMDRYLIRLICTKSYYGDHHEYCEKLGIALAANPAVAWYCKEKAPEIANDVDKLIDDAPKDVSVEDVRAAECYVLDKHDWAVVYMYPEVMNKNCEYIYNWDKKRLFELADFEGKVVLDVGAGTGRLTFAAAEKARHVYASEPVDRLREYMRDKIKNEGIKNVTVLDGMCDWLPFEDNTFDIVMSGHVVGDDFENEIAELERVTKDGGYVLDCIGENSGPANPSMEAINRGFDCLYYLSKTGGDIYRYRKQIHKNDVPTAQATAVSVMDFEEMKGHWYAYIYEQQVIQANEVRFILETLSTKDKTDDHPLNVLEVACGGGRILSQMASAGHKVTGFDTDRYMLERCAEMIKPYTNARFFVADAVHENWGSGYDVVVLAGNILINIITDIDYKQTQALFIQKAADALVTGGHLYLDFDCFDRPSIEGSGDDDWVIFEGEDDRGTYGRFLAKGGIYDASTRLDRSSRRYELTPKNGHTIVYEIASKKHFPRLADVHEWLSASGFEIEFEYGGYDRRPSDETTFGNRAVIWARKA